METLVIFCGKYLIYLVVLSVVIFFLIKKQPIKEALLIFFTAFLAWGITHLLKNIIANPRPEILNPLIVPDSLYSFPSGHTTFLSALGISIYFYNKKFGVLVLFFAVVSGISRVLAQIHFWYDIVGGIFVGVFTALLVLYLRRNK